MKITVMIISLEMVPYCVLISTNCRSKWVYSVTELRPKNLSFDATN